MLYDHPALYDALLPTSPDHLAFYLALAEAHAGGVLELACGTGQLIVPIAARHPGACGLDLSKAMLDAARHAALTFEVQLDLVEADMRGFQVGRQFAAIFVARNSLLHLSTAQDFAAVFSAVRSHLRPGGVFAFDVFNPDVRTLARPTGERFPVMRVTSETFGELVVESSNDYDAATQVNRATWFISAPASNESWQVPLHLRSIFPEELPLLLGAHGFRLLRRDGDLKGSSFTGTSGRQVCVCQAL
jgi:SAM-dependent methyltransferase